MAPEEQQALEVGRFQAIRIVVCGPEYGQRKITTNASTGVVTLDAAMVDRIVDVVKPRHFL